MVSNKGIYIAISVLALALGSLGIAGYYNLNKKYAALDKKFDATADTLKQYKATLQNQGLYGPLKARIDSVNGVVTNLGKFTEGFFDGSEKVHNELGEEIANMQGRVSELELKTNRPKK